MPTYDTFSQPPTNGTPNAHTPVGVPRGVVVLIVQNVGTTDEIDSVTYGGVALSRVVDATVFHTAGAEDGAVYTYFLGSGIPAGVQNVVITEDGTGSDKEAVCITLTATVDTVIGPCGTLDSGGVANPSVTISTPADIEYFVAGAILSGANAISGLAPGSDYTEIVEASIGANQVASFIRKTSNSQSGSVVVDWVASSDEAGIGAVTVRDSGEPTAIASSFSSAGMYKRTRVVGY